MFLAALAVPFLLAGASLAAPFTPPTREFIQELQQAINPIDRYGILGPHGFSFDFLSAPSLLGGGKDGGVVFADNTLWAGLVGNDIAMLVGFLGPCGMIAPHSHPRSSEIYLNIAGPPLLSGIIPENGAPIIPNTTPTGSAVILPQGSVHFIANTGCDPATFIAAFNAENPGALFVSAMYSAFDTTTYSAAFGGIPVTPLDPAKIPNAVIIGRQDCLAKCGINRSKFDISNVSNKELLMASFAGYLKNERFTGWSYNSTEGH